MSQNALPINLKDAGLWRLSKARDQPVWTLLYKQHFKLLNNYGYKFTKVADLIEDPVSVKNMDVIQLEKRSSDKFISYKDY